MYNQKFNYQPLARETIDGVRKYATPDGNKLASVTTILSATTPLEKKKSLMEWRKNVGEKRAQEITTEAAGRGTRMHKWLENFIIKGESGVPGSNPYSKQSHEMAAKIIESGLSNCSEFWGVEVPLYFPQLYAGTSDLVGIYQGQPSIIDFKQSNKPKKKEWIDDYFLQLCAYGQAHDELWGTKIRSGVIFMCTPNLEFQYFHISGKDWDHWQDRWWSRVEEYYTKN